jgi:hypothetical protein
MWWELLRYPSGDAQAQVFWRRRMSVLAVVGVIALLLLVLLVRGNGGPDSVTPTAAERPASASTTSALPSSPSTAATGPAASATATPSASADPSSAAAAGTAGGATAVNSATTCAAGTMALRLASDAPTYAAGAQPVLTLSFVNVGSQPCVVDLGTTSTSLTVLSGGKPVWTSTACAAKVMRPTSLTPAAAQVLQLRWDRTVNAAGCPSPAAAPAGQYEIVAKVGSAAAYGGSLVLS